MQRSSTVLRFLIFLIALLGLAFAAHAFFLRNSGFPVFENKIILSYIINAILAATIFISLYFFRARLKNYIGFLFMVGSFIKFVVFFVIFYPAFKADGNISKLEFAAFFVPYTICLILETVFTAKMLQKLD